MKIGFIGLGLMGIRMATNLLDNKYELIVYNRTKEKTEALVKKGAALAETPAEVGQNSDIVITMLADPEAVSKVAFGESGFLYQLEQKSIWIDCSTVNPSNTLESAEKANGMNIRFIDAPVAGTILPAEKGELTFFVGGEKKDVDEVHPILEAMGKKIIHLGPNGKGTSMKMVVNLVLGQAMLAFSEAVVLGESLGFSKEILFEALVGGPVTAPFIAGKQEKILKNKFDVEFPLQLMHKDFHLASQTAYENNVALPSTNAAKEIYALAKKYGLGDKDFSAIYQYLSNTFKRNNSLIFICPRINPRANDIFQ